MTINPRELDRSTPSTLAEVPTFAHLGDSGANLFDLLRFLLATFVILSHSFLLLHGDNRLEPIYRFTGGQLTLGELAVDGFFILSGFLICRSWMRSRGPAGFLKKRVLRIYPGFIAAMIFGAFVVGPIGTPNGGFGARLDLSEFVRSTLTLKGSLPPSFDDLPISAINGSLWTIRYEFFCYLVVLAIGLAGILKSRRGPALIFALTLTVYSIQVQCGGLGPRGFAATNAWPRFLSFFLAGAAFDAYRDRLPRSGRWFVAALIALIFLARTPGWRGLNPALPVLGTYAIFYVATLPIPRLQRWACAGDFSYGLYLYAFPIQQLTIHYVGLEHLAPLGLFALSMPITVVLAVASWRWIESPCLRLKDRVIFSVKPWSRAATSHERGLPTGFDRMQAPATRSG